MPNTILIVIDFINDIVNPDYQPASCAEAVNKYGIINNANTAIQSARSHNIPIAHVKVGFSDDYHECALNSPLFQQVKAHNKLKLSSPGCEFHHAINISTNDIIIIKHRISAFYNTKLQQVLKSKNITHLMICGVATNMAVELTAREAHDMDYQVTVIEDACAASNPEQHHAAIANLTRIANVITTTELTASA